MIALNGIPIIPWIFYMVFKNELTYGIYYRTVGLAALGPIFLYWMAIYLIYNGYDSMNFSKNSDTYYDKNFKLLKYAVGFDLLTVVGTYYFIS